MRLSVGIALRDWIGRSGQRLGIIHYCRLRNRWRVNRRRHRHGGRNGLRGAVFRSGQQRFAGDQHLTILADGDLGGGDHSGRSFQCPQ